MTSETMDYTGAATWDSASKQYTSDVALVSARATSRLIDMANVMSPLDDPKARALDLGAGTGVLSLALAERYPKLPILATDFSPKMVEKLDEEVAKASVNDHVQTKVLDMTDPITETTPELGFSHIFSTMAIQFVAGAPEDTLHKWFKMVRPGGVIAIAVWEFTNEELRSGIWDVWEATAKAVDPSYIPPARLPEGAVGGYHDLFAAMTNVGLEQVTAESVELGFNYGIEKFMSFFWESGNPMPTGVLATFVGDHEKLKQEMRRVLKEQYGDGYNVPSFAGLAVGTKPM